MDSLLVTLSRQTNFSVGLKLRNSSWDGATNDGVFGKYARPHGVELLLQVFYTGRVSADSGMIVNLSEVKPPLKRAVKLIENRFLDEEIDFFVSNRPTIENIGAFLWDQMPRHIGGATLHRLCLDQNGRQQIELSPSDTLDVCPVMKVSRFYEFAAAHRLFDPTLSETENWDKFDKCSNRAGHGHNFGLRVWIEGTPDPESGFVINPTLLDNIVEEEVYARFDHKHLNEDCTEFREMNRVPTSENLALVIFELLQKRLRDGGHRLVRIGLQETQKNYFEVEA